MRISAAALQKARSGGDDALKGFIDDDSQTPESRARAALDVVNQYVIQEQHEEAETYARKAIPWPMPARKTI